MGAVPCYAVLCWSVLNVFTASPMSLWHFSSDTGLSDTVGNMDVELKRGCRIDKGASSQHPQGRALIGSAEVGLQMDGKRQYAQTMGLPVPVKAKVRAFSSPWLPLWGCVVP